ncbi:MAG: nucleotide-binding protein [Candidatus Aenigmarchaeota archaeon]|nr:nucleotide-binding protein [Candidatus Aenigmarchaeota archaeon]
MKKVLLDTNFLLVPFQFKVDVYEDMRKFGEPMTLDSCVRELRRLEKGRTKDSLYAKASLILLKMKKLKIEKSPYSSDTAIIKYAKLHDCPVATNDRKLIKRLKSNGIRIIRLRQRKLLMEE